MSYQEYLAKRRQDPEYRKVEKRLKPILDFKDAIFDLRMKWLDKAANWHCASGGAGGSVRDDEVDS
jgi:hypothetical protein